MPRSLKAVPRRSPSSSGIISTQPVADEHADTAAATTPMTSRPHDRSHESQAIRPVRHEVCSGSPYGGSGSSWVPRRRQSRTGCRRRSPRPIGAPTREFVREFLETRGSRASGAQLSRLVWKVASVPGQSATEAGPSRAELSCAWASAGGGISSRDERRRGIGTRRSVCRDFAPLAGDGSTR
jgi:hypothetical protein